MKKTLALLLALLMVLPMLVVPTAAEEVEAVAEQESALRMVPMSDCDSKTGWTTTRPATIDTEIFSQGTGSLAFTVGGLSATTGGVEFCWRGVESPLDVSGMEYLRFDLYVENAAGLRNASFDVEIRDVNHMDPVDTNGDGRVDAEYEATAVLHLPTLIKGEIKDGWNTVEIPFSRLNGWNNVDKTKVAYFRMFQTNPGKNVMMSNGAPTGEIQWANVANIIGTEGVTTVIKLDNFYFTSESTTTEPDNYYRISSNYSQIRYLSQVWTSHGIKFPTEIDARNFDTLLFDVYIDDMSLAGVSLNMELCSGGDCDREEAAWSVHLGDLATKLGQELRLGWNTFEIPIAYFTTTSHFSKHSDGRLLYGPCDMSALDYFRIYIAPGKYTIDDDGDGKVGVELDETTGEPEKEFTHHLAFALPGLVTRNTDTVVDFFAASEDVAGISPQGGLSDFDGDGVKEWVLVNDSTAGEKTYAGAAVVKQLTFPNLAKPGYGNMIGIEFDIYISDARAASTGGWQMEFTHNGTCDGVGEIGYSSTLNNNTGSVIEAGKWQTVRLYIDNLLPKRDLNKLEDYAASTAANTKYGEFQAHSFNFMRWHFGYGFTAENLVVAARNFKIIRDFRDDTVEVGDNCTTPIRMSNKDGETSTSRMRIPTETNQANYAHALANVPAGSKYSHGLGGGYTIKLDTPLDVSDYDLIHFDLYFENYLPNMPYEFEMNSSGTHDAEERLFSHRTWAQITGRDDLKDGWNHITIPIRDFRDNGCKLNSVNYFRIFAQDGSNPVMDKHTVVAIDNIYFEKLEGSGYVDTCGGQDATNIPKDGNEANLVWVSASAAEGGSFPLGGRNGRVSASWNNLTEETIVSMDIYLENYAAFKNVSWQFEITGVRKQSDADEARRAGTLEAMFGAYVLNADGTKGTLADGWNHIEIPFVAFAEYKKVMSRVDFFGTYPNAKIEGPFMVAYDNVTFITPETAPETKLVSAQPTLNESIDFTIKLQDDLNRPVALECIFTGEAGTSKTVKATDYANGFYTSMFTDIPAHRMSDLLTMKMWMLDGDKLLLADTVENYSVKTYIANQLSATSDAALITLLSDLITYGAAAQVYANYETDNLVSALDEALLAKLTPSTYVAPERLETVVSGTAAENGPKFRSVTLVLDGTVHIRYTFSAESVDGLTLTVGGKTYTSFVENGECYYVDVPVAANQFGTVYNAYFGDNTAYSVNYSVNHYIATKQPTAGAKLGALLEALYNYGASAAAYQ